MHPSPRSESAFAPKLTNEGKVSRSTTSKCQRVVRGLKFEGRQVVFRQIRGEIQRELVPPKQGFSPTALDPSPRETPRQRASLRGPA